MTFEQFQATRREVADLQTDLGYDFGIEGGQPGLVYADSYYIEKCAPGKTHAYHLCLGNFTDISNDLEAFERRLYEYAASEQGWN